MAQTMIGKDRAGVSRKRSGSRQSAERAVAHNSSEPLLPMLLASPLFEAGMERRRLTPRERHLLASVATRLQLPRGYIIYRKGDPADSVFINGGGVVVAFSEMRSGRRRVAGFRFKADIFGLAKSGQYVNTTRAVTPVTVFRIPAATLTNILLNDAGLQFQFLCKMVDELRQAQRKAIIVARRDAAGRMAMFLALLRQLSNGKATPDRIALPMTRSDIGGFLNLTIESVTRACRQLADQGVVEFDRQGARIVNRRRFNELVAVA